MKKLIAFFAVVLATGCLATNPVFASDFTKPLYAFDQKSGADSLTSVSLSERRNLLGAAAWRYFGVDGYVYVDSDGPNRAPMWRLFSISTSNHIITTSDAERLALLATENWVQEGGILGYVSTVPKPGWVQLKRLLCEASTNHISTANPDRIDSFEAQGCYVAAIHGYVKSSIYPHGTPPCVGGTWSGSAQGWTTPMGVFTGSGIESTDAQIDPTKKTVMVVGASVDTILASSLRNIYGTTHNTVLATCGGSNGFIDIAAWILPEIQKRDTLDKVLIGLSGDVLCLPEDDPLPRWALKEANVQLLRKFFQDHGLAVPTVTGYPTTLSNVKMSIWRGCQPAYDQKADNYYDSFNNPREEPWIGPYSAFDGLHADLPTANAAANELWDWMP